MIKYNVTVKVNDKLAVEWLEWMQSKHIPDVMETGLFLSGSLNELIDPDDLPGRTFAIQYTCESKAHLQEYLDNHAERLQQEHTDRYRGQFVAFRTLLHELERF